MQLPTYSANQATNKAGFYQKETTLSLTVALRCAHEGMKAVERKKGELSQRPGDERLRNLVVRHVVAGHVRR